MVEKISCSVGILTFNSAKTLRRTLESVKDFSDIIISDGGSTDGTIGLAEEYGATVIEQYAKMHPGSHPDYPVDNFARERNRMLDIAKEDWFFWLDSDEYLSRELVEEIRAVCTQKKKSHYAYEIPILRQSPDASVSYRDWKQTFQIRFFNLRTGGRFERKMHERFVFDKEKYSVGRLKGSWCVPISKTKFSIYKKTVNYRLGVMYQDGIPKSVGSYLKKAVMLPTKRSLGIIYRYVRLRIKYSANEVMPVTFLRNRLYSQWVTFRIVSELYFKKDE